MSLKMTSWAWETPLPAQSKLVLMGMCDFADDDGYCFPSMNTIEKKVVGEDGKSIKSSLKLIFKAFEKMGLITKETRTRKNGSSASNIYKINQIKFSLEEYKKAYQHARDYAPTTENIDKRVANLKQNTENVTPTFDKKTTEIVTPPTENVTPTNRKCDPLEQSNLTVNLNSHKKINKKDLTIRETFLDKKLILEFIEHRREIKSPFTQRSLDIFINSLELLAKTHDAKTLIETAIVSGWKTVYAPKGASKGFNNSKKSILDEMFEMEDRLKAQQEKEPNIFEVEVLR